MGQPAARGSAPFSRRAADGGSRRSLWLLGLVVVLAVVAAVYAPTVNDFFGGDDFLVIGPVHNMGAWESIWKSIIMQDNIVYWRPLVSPIYALEVHGFWLRPWAYHLIALGLHLVNVALLALTATALTRRRGVGLAAGLVFGIHATHTTTVAQISSTVELLSVVWYVTTVLCAVQYVTSPHPRASLGSAAPGVEGRKLAAGSRRWYFLSLGAFVLALLSKESTASAAGVVTVLFLLAAYRFPHRSEVGGNPFAVCGVSAIPAEGIPTDIPTRGGEDSPPSPSIGREGWGMRARRALLDALPFWVLVIPYIAFTYLTDTDDPTGIVRHMYFLGPHVGQNMWWFLARLAAPLHGGYGPTVTAVGHAGAAVLLAAAVFVLARGTWQARFLVLWTGIALTPLALWRPDLLLGRFTYQASAPFAILLAMGGAWAADRLRTASRRRVPMWAFGFAGALAAVAIFAPLTVTQNRDRTREAAQYDLLVTALRREFPQLPRGSEVELVDGIWSGPFHALYLDAVADTLYGAGNVRIVNVDPGQAAADNQGTVVRLRYRGGALVRAE